MRTEKRRQPQRARAEIAQEIRDALYADDATRKALEQVLATEVFWNAAAHCGDPIVLAYRLLAIIHTTPERLAAKRRAVNERRLRYQAALDSLPPEADTSRYAVEDAISATESQLPPKDVLPLMGRPATRHSTAYKLIASLIPESFAVPGTPQHKQTIETLARALGLYKAGQYHNIWRRAGIRKRR